MNFLKQVLGVVLFLIVSISAYAQQYDNERDFEFRVDGNEVIITGYKGSKQEIRIPPRIQGKPVVGIEREAFIEKGIISVTIPNTVITIGNFAFARNQLTSVVIPNGVTTIGNSAFSNNQVTSVEIPNSVTYLAGFNGNQLTSVTIPNSVITIGNFAFRNNQLSSVVIPDSVTTIERSAFAGNQLTSIVISSSVTSIKNAAFIENQLTSITIGKNAGLESWIDNRGRRRINNVFGCESDGGFIQDYGFDDFYLQQGSRAGTYTYSNGRWSVQFRD